MRLHYYCKRQQAVSFQHLLLQLMTGRERLRCTEDALEYALLLTTACHMHIVPVRMMTRTAYVIGKCMARCRRCLTWCYSLSEGQNLNSPHCRALGRNRADWDHSHGR